jgi:Cdc6-like AAA superfamily ATPase
MIDILNEDYIPTSFPHREEQLDEIEKVFKQYAEFGDGDNLFLSGDTGSGKTSLIRYTKEKYDNCLYVNAKQLNTARKIFMDLTGKKNRTVSDLYADFVIKIKSQPRVLIIDEIHEIKDLQNFLSFLNLLYRDTHIPIIIITNNFNFISLLPDDARLTLNFSRVDFFSYDALQLADIIKQRISPLEDKNNPFPEEALSYICGLAVNKYSGSARTAIFLVKKCMKNKTYSQEFINKVLNQMNQEDVCCYMAKLPKVEREFCEAILDLIRYKKTISPSEIREKIPTQSPARISQLITKFVDKGIIKEEYVNTGRKKGRHRVISFINETDIYRFWIALHPEDREEAEKEQAIQVTEEDIKEIMA